MAAIQDASGKLIPSWARHVKTLAPATAFTGYKDDGGHLIPFAIYLANDSDLVFTTIDDQGVNVTHSFSAGYHPIAIATVVSSSTAALLLFANKPLSA